MDARHIAEQAVEIFHEHGGRFVPRPQPITAQGRPGDYKAGAAAARKALARTADRPEET